MGGAMTSPIAASGLVLDVAGALALASAFMLKRPIAWRQEATPYVGINSRLFLSAAMQTADAWVGAAYLAAGFGLQFSASVGWHPSWACLWRTLPVAFALDVLGAVLLFRFLRPLNVRRAIAYDLEERWPEYERDYPDREQAEQEWRLLLEGWGVMVDKDRRPGEGLQEYGRRLLGKRLWRRIGRLPPAA
jgi:hypothetical protein